MSPGIYNSGWFREPRVPVTQGKQCECGNLVFRLTSEIRTFGWLPWVTHNSELPQSPGTPETRIYGWFWEPGVSPENRCSEFRLTPGMQSSVCLLEHGVLGDFHRAPGFPCDTGNPDFHVTPRTRGSGYLWEPVVPGDSGNPGFRLLRESGIIPGWLQSHLQLRVPSRNHAELRVPGITRNSGSKITPNLQLRVPEVIRNSVSPASPGLVPEPGVLGGYGPQSSGLLLEPEVTPGICPDLRFTLGTRIFGLQDSA